MMKGNELLKPWPWIITAVQRLRYLVIALAMTLCSLLRLLLKWLDFHSYPLFLSYTCLEFSFMSEMLIVVSLSYSFVLKRY